MKKLLTALFTIVLIYPVAVCFAEGEVQVSGEVTLGVRAVDARNDSAKFVEYRDVDDGMVGSLDLEVLHDDYYINLRGDNIGLDDESYVLRGGRFGAFKYGFFYNMIPHNVTLGARTIYANPGSANLSYFATDRAKNTDASYTPNISTDPNLWTGFDYSLKRKNYGGEISITFNRPIFLNLRVDRTETTGLKPLGAPSGVVRDFTGPQSSAFGNLVEMPEPVNHTTDNFTFEGGYRTPDTFASGALFISTFNNANNFLTWRNPYVTTQAFNSGEIGLAPDNNYYKLSGTLRQRLPMQSVLAAHLSYSKLKDEFDLRTTVPIDNHDPGVSPSVGVSPTYALGVVGLSRSNFKGDINYTTASLAISSRPTKGLATKIYYNYLDRNDKSSDVTFTGVNLLGNPPDAEMSHSFDYSNHKAGLDVDYKIAKVAKISGGYEFKKVRREREDAESTTDHKFYVQLKTRCVDFLTAKVKYQRLERSSNFENGNVGSNAFDDSESINRFVRRFDATDKSQDLVKFELEAYPIDHLDLGLAYTYKHNDYDETTLGRTDDKSHEVYLDAAYELPEILNLSGFIGFERTRDDSYHRNFRGNASSTSNPSDPPGSAYNWSQDLKSDYWSYGINAEAPVIKDKFKLVFSWRYDKSNGEVDLARQAGTLQDIKSSDDYTRKVFDARAIYAWSSNLDITVGYIFEKYSYSDLQLDAYNYNPTIPFSYGYLSGAYSDPDYKAHTGYLSATYRF